MDLRFTIIGTIMIGIGVAITLTFLNLADKAPIEEFIINRMTAQAGGIIAGVGVLVLIVSFGLQRRRSKYKR